jgi:Flp pilus assembly secretin CpaC
VAFCLLSSPVIYQQRFGSNGIRIQEANAVSQSPSRLNVVEGRSVIVESAEPIVRATVADQSVARATTINSHELLLNGKTAGTTKILVLQEDGKQRELDLCIESQTSQLAAPASKSKTAENQHDLTGAYQNAMSRVQTAITGANR